MAKRIGIALAAVVAVLAGAHEAVDDVNGLLDGVIHMTTTVSELINPTKEIEAPKAPELSEGSPPAGDKDIIDAETVEEDPPTDAPPETGDHDAGR